MPRLPGPRACGRREHRRLAPAALRAWLGALLLGAGAPAAAGSFDLDLTELNEISPRPGTVIGADNHERFDHLIDPDFGKFVASDFVRLRVGVPVSFDPHPAFVQATRRFRGRAGLGAGALTDYAQGLPFSDGLSRDDARAGDKLAWNMRLAYVGDSGAIPEMHWQLRDWRSGKVEFEMEFEARSMRFMYRHVQEPVPFIENNPQDAFGAAILNAIDAGSYDGTQALVFANRDQTREPNGWVYIPPLGRTQSLASFREEESMFGSDILATDFLFYSARLSDMQWRYRGRTYMLLPLYRHDRVELAPRKARRHDYWHTDFGGRAGCFPVVNWQLRPVRILEGTATDPAAAVARRVIYLDEQTHLAVLWKVYREDGALWKFNLGAFAHPNSHVASNNETGAPIMTAFSTIDIQTNRCTTVQLLTLINVDDISPDEFDTRRMQSGRGLRR
ncbi:MAG: DUF1329 domain-containing protein [Gammaproteobacteria bacterium]